MRSYFWLVGVIPLKSKGGVHPLIWVYGQHQVGIKLYINDCLRVPASYVLLVVKLN